MSEEIELSSLLGDHVLTGCQYGLCFDDEVIELYDTHPSQLHEKDKINLGKMIKQKCIERGYNKIIFYNSSPLLSVPYFQMLYFSGIEFFYITNLALLNKKMSLLDF